MTETQNFFTNENQAQAWAWSVSPDPSKTVETVSTREKNDVTEKPKSTKDNVEKNYYNVKIPTLKTAFKSLWNWSKDLAEKVEPIADGVLDKLVWWIAKVAGLPDPKTWQGWENLDTSTPKNEG